MQNDRATKRRLLQHVAGGAKRGGLPRPLSPLRARIEFLGFRIPVALIRGLPFAAAFRLGERLGDLAYVLARPQRRTALINLRIAFPEKSESERLEILHESCRNFGRIAAEWCHMAQLTPQNVAERATFESPAAWEDLKRRASGSGILILTGHFGNWELFHHVIGLYGQPIHLVYRPFRNPYFDDYVNRERVRTGTILISKRSAARPIVQVLRRPSMVAIAFDQNATGRWGVFADFFGVPASTHPGLARLHALSDAPVCPFFLVRVGGSAHHKIVFPPEVQTVRSADRTADTVENTRRFNLAFEDIVRRYPEQWIWMHKRWRTRPPGAPPIY